jgi:hypothetical protein
MAFCNTCREWKNAERYFGKYKSGNPKSICRLCDSARQQAYKKRMLADPKTAARYKATQNRYAEEWRNRPGNKERQRKYRRDWYERNKKGEAIKRSREEYIKRHPERIAAAQKKYRQSLQADPKKHQEFLEKRRIEYHLRRERKGLKLGPKTGVQFKQKETRVSTAPFRAWLLPVIEANKYSVKHVALMAGIDPSGLDRIVSGRYKIMEIGTADKVLTALSGPPLRSLYPDA